MCSRDIADAGVYANAVLYVKFFADTHAIFFTRGICQPLMEDYANTTVTLAINRETGMVVVIG